MDEEQNNFLDSRNLSTLSKDTENEVSKRKKRGKQRRQRPRKDKSDSPSQLSTLAGVSTTSSSAVTPAYQGSPVRRATPKTARAISSVAARNDLDRDATPTTASVRRQHVGGEGAQPKKTRLPDSRSTPSRDTGDGALSTSRAEEQAQTTEVPSRPSSTTVAAGTSSIQANGSLWGSGLFKALPLGKASNDVSCAVVSPPVTSELFTLWPAARSVEAARPTATEGAAKSIAQPSAVKEETDDGTALPGAGSQPSQIPGPPCEPSSTGSAVSAPKPVEQTDEPSRSPDGTSPKASAGAAATPRDSVLAGLLLLQRSSKGPTPGRASEATAAKPEGALRVAGGSHKPLSNLTDGLHDTVRVQEPVDTLASGDRNPWVRAAVISAGLSLFCVALVIIVVQLRDRQTPGDAGDPLCQTEDCERHALLLGEVTSEVIDPCDDFSKYVCSAWSPHGMQTLRYTSAMDAAIYGWMRGLNETLHEGSAKIPVGRKAMLMYDVCTGDDSQYGNSTSEFLLFLNETGLIWPFAPVPKVDALTLFVSLAFYYDASFWFSVAISDSPSSSDEWRVVLSPSFYLPMLMVRYRNIIESGAYAVTWTKILRSFAGGASSNLDEAAINETNVVGAEILRQLYAASADPSPESALFAVSEFGNYTPAISPGRWLNALQLVLPVRPTMATEVFVTHVGYMNAIDDLFGRHENQQLVRHLSWLFMKMYIPAAAPEFFIGVYGSAERSKIYRPLFCGYNVELPYRLLVSVMCYVSNAYSNHRPLIDATFDSLVLAATEKLMNCFWLDTRSKILAVEKIKAVQMHLWPEDIVFEPGFLDDVYKDFPANETSTFGSYWIASRKSVREAKKSKLYRSLSPKPISSAEPYLTYDAILNRVLVTMGAVSRPIYYRNGTRGMLYGGIGFLMTLQLVKSLDRNGLRWHPNGSAVNSFLAEESSKEFAARDSCRVREANASVFPEIPAVEVAYAALQRALKQDGRRFRIAKNLTEERVFFTTLCFMTCPRRYTPSPYRVDCNKALQNFPEFSQAFQCPEGSKMNPAKKCRFFDAAPPHPYD
ncbi:endothelin-converting enzyme 1-like [Dermacentor variabilis]|uniref:endothelin-converting enzyme 1-like n=1 Tax=Dermacentor variabilis TaxID=34621 RepID=UPI003F5C130A